MTIIKLTYEGEVVWNARTGVGQTKKALRHNSQSLFAVDPNDGADYVSYMLEGDSTTEYVMHGFQLAKILPDGSGIAWGFQAEKGDG